MLGVQQGHKINRKGFRLTGNGKGVKMLQIINAEMKNGVVENLIVGWIVGRFHIVIGIYVLNIVCVTGL